MNMSVLGVALSFSGFMNGRIGPIVMRMMMRKTDYLANSAKIVEAAFLTIIQIVA